MFVELYLVLLFIVFISMKDMVAFSCCEYDGGAEEKREMDIARERSWRGKFKRKNKVIKPGTNRINGKCPMTPLEVYVLINFFFLFFDFLPPKFTRFF